MKIVTQPSVRVIAATHYFAHPDKPIPPDGTHVERLGAHAAKACYASWGDAGRSVRENQRRVIQESHGSVLEHGHVSLHISGITRALAMELNRHRFFNISQRSTRYTSEEDAAVVLEPFFATLYARETSLHLEALSPDEWHVLSGHVDGCRDAFSRYAALVRDLVALNPEGLEGTALRKWARGKARNVLPHALETEGVWTSNFRALRHFLEARSSRHAEAEIRRLAEAVWLAVRTLAPSYFDDYTPAFVGGFAELITPHGKV